MKMGNAKTPLVRFPEFKDAWEEKLLGDLLLIERGASPRPIKKYVTNSPDGVPWIKIGDVAKGSKYIEKTEEKITLEGAKLSRSVQIGDFVLSNSMSFGRPYILKINGSIHDGWLALRNKNQENLDTEFLYVILRSRVVRQKFLRLAAGSAVKNLKSETVKTAKIALPAINEQKKIGVFLSKVDEWIENIKKQKESWEKYKNGTMQKIFSQKIRFKDENGKEFPKWEEKKLSEISNKKSSNIAANQLGSDHGPYKIYGATGYLQNVDFYAEREPYISIVKDGAGVGRVLLCEAESSVLGTLDIIKTGSNNVLIFLYYLLLQFNFYKFLVGSGIPHIYFKDYSKEPILVPIKPEQQKIGEFLTSLDKVIESKQKQIELAESWKKGLMQRMFI